MKRTLLYILLITFSISWSMSKGQGTQFAYSGNTVAVSASGNYFSDGGQDDATVLFYPNPVKNYLNVKFPDKGNYTVRIYNIVGEKITERSVYQDDLVRVNLSDLMNGMYFLSYDLNGRVVTKTFSKTQ